MATQKMTEYELKRMENIKRNKEILAALKIHSKASQLFEPTKRQRAQTKSFKVSPVKKRRAETPVVLRRSLRTRGEAPDASFVGGLENDLNEKSDRPVNVDSQRAKIALEKGPISMKDAYNRTDASDSKLVETMLRCYRDSDMKESSDNSRTWRKAFGSTDVAAMNLEPENIARVVPGRILNVRFLPIRDAQIVVVGNKSGDVGLWNIGADDEDTEGIYVYHPHPAPISGITMHPFSLSKMYTSCYDGFIRSMDFEKQIFDMVYSGEHSVYSMSQRTDDPNAIYFGEGKGELSLWDERSGKISSWWNLHESRINTIDFNSQDTNIMATSSTDRTACIWDLRMINAEAPSTLKTITHERAVQSAYFSPSGKSLATTSSDDLVGLSSGDNYNKMAMVFHNNQTGRWLSTFRAIWGWDDSHVFIGNMSRGVDVISTAKNNVVATLESEHMSAIPCRFDTHPYEVGTLATATSGGQVYIWKPTHK